MNEKVMRKNRKGQLTSIRLIFELHSAGAPNMEWFPYILPHAKEMNKQSIVHGLCGYLYRSHTRLGPDTFYHRKMRGKRDPPLIEKLVAFNGCWGMGIIFFSGVAMNKLRYRNTYATLIHYDVF